MIAAWSSPRRSESERSFRRPASFRGSVATRLKSRASACGGLWSGGELEQFSDEGCLSLHVAATDLPNLPLPHHRHRLVASQGSSGGPEAGEAEPRPGQAFDPPMVLFSGKRRRTTTLRGAGRFWPDVVGVGGRRDGGLVFGCKGRSYDWSYERSQSGRGDGPAASAVVAGRPSRSARLWPKAWSRGASVATVATRHGISSGQF